MTDGERGDKGGLRLLNWNLRAPAASRAARQCEWIRGIDPDVVVVTELKSLCAASVIIDRLDRGLRWVVPEAGNNGYFTMLGAKNELVALDLGLEYEPGRVASGVLSTSGRKLVVVGAYVPSRGPKGARNVAKRRFQASFASRLDRLTSAGAGSVIVTGDFNVVEPEHWPRLPVFGKWEYDFYREILGCGFVDAYRVANPGGMDHSWFGRSGHGYRIDHVFVSRELQSGVKSCSYLHECRECGLSDHSAMTFRLTGVAITNSLEGYSNGA